MGKATREAYGEALAELAKEHENIFVFDADLSGSTKTATMKAAVPERHFNFGIAEANMMAAAAGAAASGKVVYASTFAIFAAGRAYDQIRNSICYPRLNVKVCATHAGVTVGEDGASHQSIEDIALMRAIPNMKVFQPCDAKQAKEIVKAVYEIDGPCYVRLGRSGVDDVYGEDYRFEIGKGSILSKGERIAIVASGMMVQECLKAKGMLKRADPTIIDMPSIKPIDRELLVETAKAHDVIITVEEHSVIGGLGGAVAEALAPYGLPCKQKFIGMQDEFGRSGEAKAVLAYYKLDAAHIAEVIDSL